jgi:adenine/guanine phosphoribosyltransferase-like PRPP-binding protein
MYEFKTQILDSDGRKYFRLSVSGYDFDLPFKLLGGKMVAFLDISGRFRLIECCADNIVSQLIEKNISFDTIVNPVAKSNALAHAIAVRWSEKSAPSLITTVVARKSADGASDNKVTYRSVTTPADQTLAFTPDDNEFLQGKRILVVDDVFGSGGTFSALQTLADNAGAEIAARAVIAVEEGSAVSDDVIRIFTLPTI